MGGLGEDLLAGLATTPWQPRSVRAPARDSLPLRLRLGLLAAVALLHVLATLLLLQLVERNRAAAPADAIVVDFIDAAPTLPPPANETITIHAPKPATPSRHPRPPTPTRTHAPARPAPAALALQVPSPAAPALRLYNDDGSLRVPADMLDRLDEQFGDKRTFSYQIPHLDDAHKYFDRNPALVYESTRFDQYWTPNADALTSLLTKLVEATTREVKVKVPGRPGSYMVCKVSILAMGGGCGVLTNGSDWNGPQDDPATLNEEEQRQCAAWWQQIVGARTQDAWRATRALYERECRKPRERAAAG